MMAMLALMKSAYEISAHFYGIIWSVSCHKHCA